MKLINNFTIGADIELFLKHAKTGEVVSAEGLIKGTKKEPFVFDKTNKYFATSLDNVLAEFCIPPAGNVEDFYTYIRKCMDYIQSTIPKELTLHTFPSAKLEKKYLRTKNAKLFGCDPDCNVWMRCQNQPPVPTANLRSAGGHIHVGYDDNTEPVNEYIVKAMDLFLGVPSIIQEPDNDRKSLYGKAGAFRFKPYGVEYRTISNYYTASKELTNWVYNNTVEALNFINEHPDVTYLDFVAQNIQDTINGNNKLLAKDLINYFGVKLAA